MTTLVQAQTMVLGSVIKKAGARIVNKELPVAAFIRKRAVAIPPFMVQCAVLLTSENWKGKRVHL